METFQTLVQKINTRIGNSQYFYISNEVEHGLGLSEWLNNFHHVCLNHTDQVDYLQSKGRSVACIHQLNPSSQARSSADLLSEFKIQNLKFRFESNQKILILRQKIGNDFLQRNFFARVTYSKTIASFNSRRKLQ